MSNAIPFRMNYSVPGDLTRMAGLDKVKAEAYGATAIPAYGVPVKLAAANGGILPISTQADTVYGILVRPFPYQQNSTTGSQSVAVPLTSGIAQVLLSGYVGVVCNVGTPVEGGQVYVWTAATGGGHTQGGIEATAVGGSNFAIPNCYFTGPMDASNNVEIAFNI